MNFNKLYENIFKPASENELKDRKQQGEIEKFKEWMDYSDIRYKEDSKGNLISVDKNDIVKQDINGVTPLNYASYNIINYKVVKLLIDSGADVNDKDRIGNTPLINACIIGDIEIVKLLLDNGADVNAENKWYNTPLTYAKDKHNQQLVDLLIQHGAK